MKIPSVSVILPCYNAAQTLEETLESIEGQTHKDFEVIAVDDGSTDRTADILDHRSKRDSRFKCIFQPHGGVISASNAGMLASVSPYIARLDADDRAHPQRLEKQIAFLDENPDTALVGCLVKAFPEEDVGDGFRIYIEWLNALVSDDDIRREIFIESPLPNPSVMIRREWMLRMGGYQDHGWPEDYDLFLRLYLAGARFAKIPEVLHEWRDHPNRITHTDSRYSLENFLRTKAYYLARGPLKGRDAVIVWGSGMMGRRLAKQLERQDMPLVAFVDIDPKKIGRTRRAKPIIAPDELGKCWGQYQNPVILASVGSRGARKLIRQRLNNFGYKEGIDWWASA
ncbi:MAG: glycosyltransferase [Anaerolineales bacterium]|uniref:Glycosyltransferase n=1 Tax=Candidatus Desulfolinea nitratireducens TaxID=2841698 RepID=A0A8J6TGS5_9CHLR|nr:glycosyltransferase [Candidatus Desulfolinea nitratireducens]MBL6961892.1 glycosyltransferase [Anaerolineales bacterium]